MRAEISNGAGAASGSAGAGSPLDDHPASRLIRGRADPHDTVLASLTAVPYSGGRREPRVGVQRGSQMTSGMSRSVRRW
jgi:hypothetical protein